MKTTTILLILFLTGLDLWAQVPPAPRLPSLRGSSPAPTPPAMPAPVAPATPFPAAAPAAMPSAANAPDDSNSGDGTNEVAAYNYTYKSVTIDQLLEVYSQQLVGRTLLRAPGLNTTATVVLETVTPLTKSEAIQVFQSLLSLNGIVVQNVGDKFVKVLPVDQAGGGGQKPDTNDVNQLPELGTYVTHIVHLYYTKPSAMLQILTPFAKLPGAITPLEDNGILILRDNAENVKRMLELIAQVDTGGGEMEMISEVIPIRYALAQDIANALTSLGGSGNATVSIGSAAGAPGGGNGIARPAGGTQGGAYGGTQPRTLGIGSTTGATPGTTPNGTPAVGAGTFQSRLLSIVNNAAQGNGGKQEPIQIFGQTKIIADQRSNSLLVFATRSDMDAITNVIAKLDVLLSQVLIESAIIDVDLTKGLNTGVSVAQNPEIYSSAKGIAGGGGSVNGPTFINFLNNSGTYTSVSGSSNAPTTILGNALSGGLSYFGNIGPTWDVALQAAASDSSASVIQRPRIQTSQAKAASFFVGETVPYVTGSTYGSAYGNSSSYSQLSVGVSLQVTPFINPDGLVVMDIDQEIDDLDGFTPIQNVGNVPNTTKRTLQSEIAVKDKDTIMLGGFIRSNKSNSKSGVPYLQDIPLIGNLFTSRINSSERKETIVLIRPTVLRTPDIAAEQAVTEQKRLPGVAAAVREDISEERKQVEKEANAAAKDEAATAKAALKNAKSKPDNSSGIFLPVLPDGTVLTNTVAPSNP